MARVILVKNGSSEVQNRWISSLREELPKFTIEGADYGGDFDQVEYIVGWCPDADWVNRFNRLRCLISIGSGVDHIVGLDKLRSDIPVLRTVSDQLTQRMVEFVTMTVLAGHRRLPAMIEASRENRWQRFPEPTAPEVTVGVLGYGRMGKAVIAQLNGLGYKVRVWAHTPRKITQAEYFYGPDQLIEMTLGCNVLVCLLPLTSDTRGILNRQIFENLSRGAIVINASRGDHVNYEDLRLSLDAGHLGLAFLDGLPQEPLPVDSPIWSIDKAIITGHSAAYISPDAGPKIIAGNILKMENDEQVGPFYDRTLGY